MKIIIESITEWEKDNAEIAGDMGHGSTESDVLRQIADETNAKKESEWTKGLPFVYETDLDLDINAVVNIGQDIQELMDDALTQYSDQYCSCDYLKPSDFEGRLVA